MKSDDDCGLELRLAMPRSLGGKGDGQNPEQLFAMGYAGAYMRARGEEYYAVEDVTDSHTPIYSLFLKRSPVGSRPDR